MPTSVLHVSDLHRDSGSQLSTAALLDSLRRDRERYVRDEAIPAPDLAIISGDIVYGVKANEVDADAKLEAQYNEAYDFLVQLADTFFGGRRERVVIVPGNHDVSLPHVHRATTIVDIPADAAQRAMLSQQLSAANSTLRWDWADLTARRIINLDEYHRRLAPFANF